MNKISNSYHKNYASAAMHQRRSRILDATRKIISQGDLAEFRVSDVANAAGVAVKTVYGLFGRRDQLIIHAILENFSASSIISSNTDNNIVSNIRRLERTVTYFCSRKNELAELSAIYFSRSADQESIEMIDRIFRYHNNNLINSFDESILITKKSIFVDTLAMWEISTLFSWSVKKLTDDVMPFHLINGYIYLILSLTNGYFVKNIREYLHEIIPIEVEVENSFDTHPFINSNLK